MSKRDRTREVKNAWLATPSSIFVGFYVLFLGVGALVTVPTAPRVSAYCLALLAVFVLLGRVFSRDGKRGARFLSAIRLGALGNLPTSTSVASYGALATLVVAGLYMYAFGIPVLDGNPEYARLIGIQRAGPVFRIVMLNVPFFCTYLAVCWYERSRDSDFSSLPAWMLTLIASLLAIPLLLAFRSATLDAILALAYARLVYVASRAPDKGWRVVVADTRRLVIRLSIPLTVAVGAVGIVTALRYSGVGEGDASPFFALVFRLFVENAAVNVASIMDWFSANELLYGKGILMDLSALTPWETPSFAVWMTFQVNPFTGDMFVMTPTVAGEAFANFGWSGVFVLPVILYGIFGLISEVVCFRRRLSTEAKAAAIFLTYYFPRTCVTHGVGAAIVLILVPTVALGTFVVLSASLVGNADKRVTS